MRRLVLVVVLMLLTAGCFGDEDPPTSQATTGSESPETAGSAGGGGGQVAATVGTSDGCPADQRVRLSLAVPYSTLVKACVDAGRTTIHLDNVSPAVLLVWPVSGGMSNWEWQPPDDYEDSLAGPATLLAVQRYAKVAPLPAGQLLMPPEWSVLATLLPGTSLDLRVEGKPTATAYAAKATADWIEERVTARHEQFADNVAKCAEGATELWAAGTARSWEDALGVVFFKSSPCLQVRKQVKELANPPAGTADDATRIGDDLARSAKRVSTPLAELALSIKNAALKLMRAA